eukprot:TRINITY_DN619_c0_g1_i1.p1 TRINITY_DN619_c0_g1~~TRINITY_DN619_c0_g1_i1.p1  ORF type:complete len:758 (-),score=192.37 TRINITY_DN619_c0_g1_i1:15-2222(-)
MSFHDLVASCGEANPLTRATNQLGHNPLQDEFDISEAEMEHLFPGQQPYHPQHAPDHVLQSHSAIEHFFNPHENNMYEPQPFNNHPQRFDGLLQAPVGPTPYTDLEQADMEVEYGIKHFINASRNHSAVPNMNLGLHFNPQEQMQIKSRLSNIHKHMHPVQDPAADYQLQRTFQNLNLHPMQQQQHPHDAAMASEWAQDFDQMQQTPEAWAQDFNRYVSRDHSRHDQWVNQFNKEGWATKDYSNHPQEWTNTWRESEEKYKHIQENKTEMSELETKIKMREYLENLSTPEAMKELEKVAADFSSKLEVSGNEKLKNSEFTKLMTQIGAGQKTIDSESKTVIDTELSEADEFVEEFGKWASEGNDWRTAGGVTDDQLEMMQRIWKESKQISRNSMMQSMEDYYRHYPLEGWMGGPRYRDYAFTQDNKYLSDNRSVEELMNKGKELFARGELDESVLVFEAVLQRLNQQGKQNSPESVEMWRYLGEAQAENDNDERAISALRQAYSISKQTNTMDSSGQAMMSLSVSLTNEGEKHEALGVLREWIGKHGVYKGLFREGIADEEFEQLEEEDKHDEVADMYLQAARVAQREGRIDPDVQIGLGLLFNLSQEYEKAVDCFKTALKVRPDDYLLWNKLGATLANHSRSNEALGPYYKSLELKPTYTRARTNLGISYMNMDMYEEAASQFLGVLALQPNGARHVWMNLQTVLGRMDREDREELLDLSVREDVEPFRRYFDF